MSTGPIHEEEALGKAYDARLMRRLLGYLRPYLPTVAAAFLLIVIGSGLQIAGPWLVQLALDDAIPQGDLRLLSILASTYLLVAVLGFGLEYLENVVTTWLGQSVMYDLRTEIFGKLQNLDLSFYDRNPVGRLMTRITSDVETLNNLFSSGVIAIFGDVFTLMFVVTAMLLMDWQLALVTLSVLPFVVWAVFLFRSRIRSAYRDIRVRVARLNAFFHERITGMREVQLFNREEADARRMDEENASYLEAHLRSITYYALFFPVVEVFTAIALALIVWYGGLSILAGSTTVGVVTAFLLYARRFFRPIQDLSEKYNLLQAAMASSERIFKLVDVPFEIEDPSDPELLSPSTLRGEIEFEDVWFAYRGPGRRRQAGGGNGKDSRTGSAESASADTEPEWVLKGLSFRVAPGEKLAIVGHTGAGKTTIINLLMRFYVPQRGQIRVDGISLERLRRADLRQAIGLVLQDVFLFSEDIGYNIRLGVETISEERVLAAANEVGAGPIVERLPEGLGHPLGERGTTLSTGERQLVSFARALAFDPRILVLDEATSSVDSEIEERIDRATARLMAGRTSIVIAHRLSTIRGADRILVLHRGELEEEGTHEALLAVGGLYAKLHELQFAAAPTGSESGRG